LASRSKKRAAGAFCFRSNHVLQFERVVSAAVTPRPFPPPWSVEDIGAAFVVKDSTGQQLAYVYFEDEPGRQSAAKLLTRDESRRIAVNIAKLHELLKRP
jgi:hypothetical protein